jgi:hypothetical protein
MYIDFEPNKLGDELKQKTLDDLSSQGIPPSGGDVVTMAAIVDANGTSHPEDGGGPLGEVYSSAILPEDGSITPA